MQIKGCRKTRMISFFPSGKISMKRHLCNCENCALDKFDECTVHTSISDNINVQELIELDESDDMDPELFTFIEKDNYVAVYSQENSLELFYVIKVFDKCIADEDTTDIYSHVIQKGAQYCNGYYLEKISEKKQYIYYKQLKKAVYFYPNEVFSPWVPIDEDLCLPLGEYLFLANSI